MSVQNSGSAEISIHEMEWQGIQLTESAVGRITQLSSNGQFFHLSVKPSGCTGFAYNVQLINEPKESDVKFHSRGVDFYIALSALPMIDGTEIDYVRQGLNSNLVYHNPNVKNMCGCGESFGV
ncbi:iron-sulfur cluster assembly accessory protein [Vibrio sp. 99-70-13A1]|uniref:iron-sulfur cluster assembly accessory protein n=1 Tax=Vibrio sp. 99-70-13A1 TaxID=2607601 RepID=UPI0014939702|nr:iron-sulfur cluster assembly accessory protein [Vibrio sp. 99-70-13A1]NOH97375.1 iron-sulfur cluster assembly accessory protein [Vibrio sp. 99-70-13A1]